jgi:hypothetical protein
MFSLFTRKARQKAEAEDIRLKEKAEALYAQARVAEAIDDKAAAHTQYAGALTAAPTFEAAYLDWCRLLFQENRQDEAAALIERGLSHLPESGHLHLYLGNLRYMGNRFADAAVQYEEALRLLPGNPAVLTNLGQAQLAACRHDDAGATLRQALELDPDNAVAGYCLGHLALLLGRFEAGWDGFALRDRQGGMRPNPVFPRPLLTQNADVAGKTVMLHAEQGYGDTLQFIRYAALVAARGARVIAVVPKPLLTLVARCPGVAEVGDSFDGLGFDFYSPLLSLPGVFKTTLHGVPQGIPYLGAAPERIAHWRARLGPATRPRVGLAWAGNPGLTNGADSMRSVRLEALRPLLALPGIEFHSLQVDDAAVAQIGGNPAIADHARELSDFQETAALIEQLDLVVSVDTAVAHLAGAMGKPVWLLNRYNTCWRWMLERSDSPWYPSMRIFRQQKFGDWDGVIAEVAVELRALSGTSGALAR